MPSHDQVTEEESMLPRVISLENGDDPFADLSVAALRRRGTSKWSLYGDNVLPAWVAEMDFPLAAPIRDALHEAIELGEAGYAPSPAASGVPAACAAWLARQYGLSVAPHQIRILPDVVRGLVLSITTLSRPDSPVVIMTPAYPPFFEAVRMAGRTIIEVPLMMEEGRATFDLVGIVGALHAGAGTILLCNPHNPLGRVFTRSELAALAALVEEQGQDVRVVADEVHAPLVYPGATHVAYATVSEAAARQSVTLTSASKGWNVPGLKCAQIVLTNEADGEWWDRLSFLATYGVSPLGMLANRVAFEQGEPWLNEVVAYLDGNRDLLARLLGEKLPQVQYAAPEGTYLAWLDCRALDLADPAAFFLERAKVALSDGAAFGSPGQGHVRLNFATSRAILTDIIEAMADTVA